MNYILSTNLVINSLEDFKYKIKRFYVKLKQTSFDRHYMI